MNAEATIAVSGVIVMLLQVFKASDLLKGKHALAVCALMSALGVWLWAASAGDFERPKMWSYFAGWVSVFTSAAGVFGIVNSGADAVTTVKGAPKALMHALTGTGDGRSNSATTDKGE